LPLFNDSGSYGYELADQLKRDGFVHILQLAFPGIEDTFEGSWIFGEHVFHLYCAEHKSGLQFKYLWD